MSRSIFQYLRSHFQLSLSAFYFYAPISVMAVPLIFWTEELPASIAELLLVGMVITTITFFIYWFLIYVFQRFHYINQLISGALILIVTGILRGLILFNTFEVLGYQNPTPLLARISSSIFNVFVWLALISIVSENNQRFIRRYRALLTQILVLKLRNNSDLQPGYSYIEDHILKMQLRLKKSIGQIRSATEISNPEKLMAEELRKEIEEELKPLNQRLWVKSAYDPPSIRFNSVLETAVSELKFRFPLTATIFLAFLVVNTFLLIGSLSAFCYGLLSFFSFYLFNKIRLNMVHRFYEKRRVVNSIFLILVGFTVGTSTTILLDLVGLSHSYSAIFFIAPILSLLVLASSFIELTISDRRTLMEILSRESMALNEHFLEKMDRGNAASYLHNSLQSELSSLAIQLDSIAKNPDLVKSQQITQRIESFISRSSRDDYKDFLETPESRIKRIIESWDGIADIDSSIDEEIFNDPSRASLVVQLIQEAIANAVRSGSANKIKVTGQYSGDSFKISVQDNGQTSSSDEKRGMGSEWIDSVAAAEWVLEQSENGRTLRVEI